MSKKDYYQTLGVSKGSSEDELKKAYRKLAMQYHPDQNPGNKDAEHKFKELNEAYDILKDPQKRAAYDRMGHAAFEGGHSGGGSHNQQGFSDFSDIFGDVFSDLMGGGSRRRSPGPTRGSDLQYNIKITLEEAFTGVSRNISCRTAVKCGDCDGKGSADKSSTVKCTDCNGHGVVRMQQGFFAVEQTCRKCSGSGQIIKNPCKKCSGNGRVEAQKNHVINIPAGIEDAARIRYVGEGEHGPRGGQPGDLYIVVNIQPHKFFKVEGSNIRCTVPVGFTHAVLGGAIEVPTIDGNNVKLKIPKATQSGEILRIKDRGMNKIRSSHRGDMYVHVIIDIPKKLTAKQEEIIEQLHKEFAEEDKDSSILNKVKNLWS